MFTYINSKNIKAIIDSYPEHESPYRILMERIPSFKEIPFSKRIELICRANMEDQSKSCVIIVTTSESIVGGLDAIVYVDGELICTLDITEDVRSGRITYQNQEDAFIHMLKLDGFLDQFTNYSCVVSGV